MARIESRIALNMHSGFDRDFSTPPSGFYEIGDPSWADFGIRWPGVTDSFHSNNNSFSYDYWTRRPTSGTITDWVVKDVWGVQFVASGLSASVADVFNAGVNGDSIIFRQSLTGNDTIIGSGSRDVLDGFGGNDAINAGGGDDVLYGGAGNNPNNW